MVFVCPYPKAIGPDDREKIVTILVVHEIRFAPFVVRVLTSNA
jgi:hypothetical protein